MFREEWLRWAETKRRNSESTAATYRREWNKLARYAEEHPGGTTSPLSTRGD
jgi:hypothetical protein